MTSKTDRPLVSVVIAAYNIEEYIKNCMDSIISQSYDKLDIIAVDDGSTDNTPDILDTYSKEDTRVKVVHKKNGGLVSARKCGNNNAHGDYILHIDGDDYISSLMVEKLVNCVIDTDADAVQCGFIDMASEKEYHYPEYAIQLDNEERERIVGEWMEGRPRFDSQLVTKLCKSDFIKKIYESVPDENSHSEDWLSYAMIVGEAHRIASIKDVLYYYVCRKDSYSHKRFSYKRLLAEDSVLFQINNIFKSYFSSEQEIESFMIKKKIDFLTSYFYSNGKVFLQKYAYNDIDKIRGLRVIIYGAGKVGADIVKQLSVYEDIYIAGWLDKSAEKYNYDFRRVQAVSTISNLIFDYVIIAILNEAVVKDVKSELEHTYGINPAKIIWNYEKRLRYE